METNQELVFKLTGRYDDLKRQISQARRKGLDPILQEIRLMGLKPLIKMVEAYEDPKEINKANEIIDRVEKELKELYEEAKKEEIGEKEQTEQKEESKENSKTKDNESANPK